MMSEPLTFEELKKRWVVADKEVIDEFTFYYGSHFTPDVRLLMLEKRFAAMMGTLSASLNMLIEIEKAKGQQ